MLVVLTPGTCQSTGDGGVHTLLDLLGHVELEWHKHLASSRRTMNDLKLPPSIEYLILGGREYRIGGPRKIWLKRDDKAPRLYDPTQFYVTEAIDREGHPHQLAFNTAMGTVFDGGICKVQPIGAPVGRSFSSKGPLVRE